MGRCFEATEENDSSTLLQGEIKMNKTEIAIKKLEKVVLPAQKPTEQITAAAMTLQANIMSLGYIMDEDLLKAISGLPVTDMTDLSKVLVKSLKELKGDNVIHKPMYPNFPRQVIEADYLELVLNAIMHYWSFGHWKPDYEKLPREFAFENVKFRTLGLASEEDFASIFTKILASNDSVSDTDKKIIEWFLQNYGNLVFPETIPFKENLCIIGAYMVENGIPINELVKNPNDVLRVATHMSGGDVSLADNTKFRNFKRPERRILVKGLESVINREDLVRHSGKWVKLAHALHVGDYSKKVYDAIKPLRENESVETFNTKVERHLAAEHPVKATKLLVTRPGDFARRLDHLLRMAGAERNQIIVANKFVSVADSVSTKVLLQLKGHFATRSQSTKKRVVFPKGNIQKAELISGQDALPARVVNTIVDGISKTIVDRFSKLEDMGNVYIDPALERCPIPSQQRSASDGTHSAARGTRFPFGFEDTNTVRFFLYWVGLDIDLSAVLYDENFRVVDKIWYGNIRSPRTGLYHSGDITRAPNGASEFVDIDIEKARIAGARYVAMNVMVFSGKTFADHDTCFVGWMSRSEPKSNEIYDPKTVECKLDMTFDSTSAMPVIVDLEKREIIWTDMSHADAFGRMPNNVDSNAASIRDVVEAMLSINNKVSLYDLFMMHAKGRNGTIVNHPTNADTVFGLFDGDITPSSIMEINSDYIV